MSRGVLSRKVNMGMCGQDRVAFQPLGFTKKGPFKKQLWFRYRLQFFVFSGLVIQYRSVISTRSTGSRFTCLEPRLNWSQHKTNGALVHSNSSVIQLLLYDVITSRANRVVVETSGRTSVPNLNLSTPPLGNELVIVGLCVCNSAGHWFIFSL